MVKGAAALNARFQRAQERATVEIRTALKKSAKEIVADMNATKPIPELEYAWRWGDEAPAGAMRVASSKAAGIKLTIYAIARTEDYPQGHSGVPMWFEFGTSPRTQKTTGRYSGFITAQPNFWPVFRSHKARIKGRLTRAVRKALKAQ